jgi:hypothetical protein
MIEGEYPQEQIDAVNAERLKTVTEINKLSENLTVARATT